MVPLLKVQIFCYEIYWKYWLSSACRCKGVCSAGRFWFRVLIFDKGFKCWRLFVFIRVIKQQPEQHTRLKANLTFGALLCGGLG